MEFIKNFNQSHYTHYLPIALEIIGNIDSFNKWLKTISNFELEIFIFVIDTIEKNDDEYYEEMAITLTILIHYFIVELDTKYNKIKLSNEYIKKILNRFKYMIYREYSNRNKIVDIKIEEYNLLK